MGYLSGLTHGLISQAEVGWDAATQVGRVKLAQGSQSTPLARPHIGATGPRNSSI